MHLQTNTSAQSHFSSVPTISHSRNSFSIAKKHVSTIQFDRLYPMYWKYIYPGDTLAIQQSILARLQTQIAVLHDDLLFDAHAWFVPMRLIQTNWARYQFNAQPAGPSQDNSALTSPKIDIAALTSAGFTEKTVYDYLGLPTQVNIAASGQHINNYLGRAYNLIWNENYRDENIQTPRVVDLDDGPDTPSDYYTLAYRGKRHDKFTSALTSQQKGTASSLPLGSTAPVKSDGSSFNISAGGASNYIVQLQNIGGNNTLVAPGAYGGIADAVWGNDTGLYVDLSTAVSATVNQLRQSIAIQQLLEADARGGTRDVESIQHRWGVTVPDFRLQRPEFLGSTTFSFDGHIVPQTSESGTTPQATLKQFSQSLSSWSITHSFVEHGVFMILLSARSNMTYQQGLTRELSYRTRFDWYQPEFANLGDVAIKNKEIMLQGTSTDDNTFGFQEYGYELRYEDSMVTAEMRSNYATSLDSQHMAYDFATLPTLNSAFIQSETPISRNIAVSASVADPIQLNTFVKGTIARTLPMYSVPGLARI